MIITIGGLAGSGTTTATKILSKKMDVQYVSAGDIFRQMASERGMSLLEFSKFAEDNVQIDIEVDRRQLEIAQKKKKEKKNIIVEGRLSAYFVDADIKIWFISPLEVRAKRIGIRENKPFQIVKEEVIRRERSEAKRYHEIHDIDIGNLEIYDFIINTKGLNAESVADIILKLTEVIKCQQ